MYILNIKYNFNIVHNQCSLSCICVSYVQITLSFATLSFITTVWYDKLVLQ